MNLVCICVDHLHIGQLGCYGNSWSDTATLDRLAAESFICDGFITDSLHLETVYRSLWQGLHAAQPRDTPGGLSLAQLAAAAGLQTALVTDSAEIAAGKLAHDFAEVITTPPQSVTQPVDSLEETAMATLFGSAIQWLAEAQEPFLLWLHARGLGAPWDAPLELRNQFVEDEDEPLPPADVAVPELELAADFDPDQLLGIRRAYAGQVAALDACVDALREFLHEQQLDQETAVVLLSPRGFALGEHRVVGPGTSLLHEETVHVPLLIRLPDGEGAGQRCLSLLQPADLFATLADLLPAEHPLPTSGRSILPQAQGAPGPLRQRTLTFAAEQSQALLRTPAWAFCEADDVHRLYVKPDDRWEQNEIAARVPDITEQLSAELNRTRAALASPEQNELPPLATVLLHGLD